MSWGLGVHTFDPSTPEAETGRSQSEANLIYTENLRPARETQILSQNKTLSK